MPSLLYLFFYITYYLPLRCTISTNYLTKLKVLMILVTFNQRRMESEFLTHGVTSDFKKIDGLLLLIPPVSFL